MEFGSMTGGVVLEISEYNGSAGVSGSGHFQVSCHQDGSVEFRRLATSEINVFGIREIPQDALGQTGIKSTDPPAKLALVPHGSSIEFNVSASMDVDQNGLVLTFVTEVYGVDGVDTLVITRMDVEDLDFVVGITSIGRLSLRVAPVLMHDGSGRREGFPVLRFPVPDVSHLFEMGHVVAWLVQDVTIGEESLTVIFVPSVYDVAIPPGFLIQYLYIAVGRYVSSDNDAVDTVVGDNVGPCASADKVSGSVCLYR
jgi:hypothetical protein